MRRLFTILSALSLLLCVGTAALWVRSYWVADWVERRHYGRGATDWSQTDIWARSSRGLFCVGISRGTITGRKAAAAVRGLPKIPVPFHVTERPDNPLWRDFPQSFANRLGFYWSTRDDYAGTLLHRQKWEIALPHWAVAGLAAASPCYWYWSFRRRRKPGLCPRCGYDLRATSGRCPECGTTPIALK
jgi:hypothetical protein